MFAHDIRNPLAGIKKTLEWLAGRPEMGQDLPRRCLEDLRFTTDLLLGMINDMLDVYQEHYSGLPLSRSPVATGQLLLRDVAALPFRRQRRRACDSRCVGRRRKCGCGGTGDGCWVLINLLHNALKYSPPQGTITLTLLVEEASMSCATAACEPSFGSMVMIHIEDEGRESPRMMPHVFDMFFRKKDGQGLSDQARPGAAFCRLVVEAHGGRITAGNRSAGGAVLTVALPVRQEQSCLSPS